MSQNTRDKILISTVPLLATHGYNGTSMRDVAVAVGIQPSVIYHYFPNKEALFREVRRHLITKLDAELAYLPYANDVHADLQQCVLFQVTHREAIVALLQYFIAINHGSKRLASGGYVPERGYQDILRVLQRGIREGSFIIADIDFYAKVVTHLVNGFLLEYYPHELTTTEEKALTKRIVRFIEHAMQYNNKQHE